MEIRSCKSAPSEDRGEAVDAARTDQKREEIRNYFEEFEKRTLRKLANGLLRPERIYTVV